MTEAEQIMKRCQAGTRNYEEANNLHAACYGIIGKLLTQPKQEPVALADIQKEAQQIVESKILWKRFIDGTPLANDISCWMADFAQQYTTPPQRTWVGLTDEKRSQLVTLHHGWNEYGKAIEAELKEKNNA